MSAPIRVLVVDDSKAVRMIVTKVFDGEPDIEVVGVAGDGAEAVTLAQQLRPDIITCDIEMPVMDGLATVSALRRLRIDVPIVMFSSLTEAGSRATLEALSRGASDYLPKPSGVNGANDAMERLRRDLVPKIRALTSHARTGPAVAAAPVTRTPVRRESPIDAVVLGSSTGGPAALEHVFSGFTAALPVPILIVQHIPPVFSNMLAERLDTIGATRVVEASDGMTLESGHAYVAPGGIHMVVAKAGTSYRIQLRDTEPVNSCKPAVDILFGSAAETFGSRQLAVVLTGMGRDGCNGVRAVIDSGGAAIVQDQASSVVGAMPGAVAEAGLAEEILDIGQIAGAIERRAFAARLAGAR
jgi:two-component system chemotaxis response regulator CheB